MHAAWLTSKTGSTTTHPAPAAALHVARKKAHDMTPAVNNIESAMERQPGTAVRAELKRP